MTPLDRALDAWLEALRRQDPDSVHAALAADVTLWIRLPGRAPKALVGARAVADWIARTPPSLSFVALHETASSNGDGELTVRYRVAGEGFSNEGLWRLVIDSEGKIAFVEHVPDPL